MPIIFIMENKMTINVETSSLREIFDFVKNHLLTQNKKAQTLKPGYSTPSCVYRGNDGCTCAVGCLIRDEDYEPNMEGRGVQANAVAKVIFPTYAKEAQAKLTDHYGLDISDHLKQEQKEQYNKIEMLFRLQKTHDDFEPEQWPSILELIERDFF